MKVVVVLIKSSKAYGKSGEAKATPKYPALMAMLLVCLAEPEYEVRDEVTTSYFN